MTYEICVSVHQFQMRWCWQLSSILSQTGVDKKDITVSVAFVKGSGNPTTESVMDTFSDLNFRVTEYSSVSEFQYRGNVRSDQVRKSTSDWLLFTDADMVFHPNTLKFLSRSEIPKDRCSYVGRFSTELEETESIVSSHAYPCTIDTPWEALRGMKLKKMAAVGAGYFQLIGGDFIRGVGHYVKRPRDWNWSSRFSKCVSDIQFRKSVGRFKIDFPIHWYPIHLQHHRDSEFGYHIEHQR